MATSLIGGLIANGHNPQDLIASDPEQPQLHKLEQAFRVPTTTDNNEALKHASTVVLSVKPQVMAAVAKSLATAAERTRPLLVSIAAGVREPDLRNWLGYDAAIVRTMPNTPALVGSGATALFANPFVSKHERDRAEAILNAVGVTMWVNDEQLLDAVTAVSGSGPAYCFLLMELMAAAGEELGLENCKLSLVPQKWRWQVRSLQGRCDNGLLHRGEPPSKHYRSSRKGTLRSLYSLP